MRAEYSPEKHIPTGFESEKDCIGPEINWRKVFENIKAPEDGFTVKGLTEAMIENYPLDPFNPEKEWAQNLLKSVSIKLNIDPELKTLEFYNVLGSPLDQKGIDCLLVFKNPNTKKPYILSIDLTTNPHKKDWEIDRNKPSQWGARKSKADFIISADPDEMYETTEDIAKRFKDKTGPIIH